MLNTIPWRVVTAGLLLGGAAWLSVAPADAETRRVARRKDTSSIFVGDQAQAMEAGGFEGEVVVEGGCCDPAPACPPPCISYCDRSCSFKCSPRMETVLDVCDPCTGCRVAVPVCIPECTEGCPEVCGRRALFGASVVTYRWCNGFEVAVRFTRCGDIKVTYRG